MNTLQNLFDAIILLWIKWWRGEFEITLDRTYNDLLEKYNVGGVDYHFECTEFVYILSSSRWWVLDARHYIYKVAMYDGDNHTEGIYPHLTTWHMQHTQHSHHLAIRAHIKLNVDKK